MLCLEEVRVPAEGRTRDIHGWSLVSVYENTASDCVLRWTQLIVKCIIKYSEHNPAEHDGETPTDLLTLPFYLSFLPPFQSKLPQASPISPLAFPHCLQAPIQRLEQYCEALEELGGINPASDSALSILRHAQRHGEDLRASDLIVGCPVRMLVPVYDCNCQVPLSFLREKETKILLRRSGQWKWLISLLPPNKSNKCIGVYFPQKH